MDMKRKIEVKVRDGWVERPFGDLQPGDLFRCWDLVVDHNHQDSGIDVSSWRCESIPQINKKHGVLKCQVTPMLDQHDNPISDATISSTSQQDADKNDHQT